MSSVIVPASLEWRDGVPYSPQYGDVYHSAEGGVGQARHVFLAGCGLPPAWAGRERFAILETGFGTGLNFLATWAAWRADPGRARFLDYVAAEKHPFDAPDLARVHAAWPEFAPLSRQLVARWPMLTPGFQRIALDGGRVRLTLLFGDALDTLPGLVGHFDAFYLDGFAPDRNPDLWQARVFGELARLARPGACAATYTVAAQVRNGLANAGFVCEKRPGYGPKRHCLAARFAGEGAAAVRPPAQVAVVGAGVAGAATAHALASRGVRVRVIERAAAVASGASGNPLAVVRPLVAAADPPAARLTRAAFLHDLRAFAELGEAVSWQPLGVLHLARDDKDADRLRAAVGGLPHDFAHWLDVAGACKRAGWPVAAPGVFFPLGGVVAPRELVSAWLAQPGVEPLLGADATRLVRDGHGWRVEDRAGALLAEADAVVLANACDAPALVPGQSWPIQPVRGQVSLFASSFVPPCVVAREGYVAPLAGGRILVGASYEHDADPSPRASSDDANRARLARILPGVDGLALERVGSRVAFRAATPDRLPMVGPIAGHPGLHVAVAYASRGVVWAALLGETLASLMCGEPAPIERELLAAVDPGRFAAAPGRRPARTQSARRRMSR
jgi:tRNA 5-methylaminomethyl-2-thiouridine biosynthesis bifunctional protein